MSRSRSRSRSTSIIYLHQPQYKVLGCPAANVIGRSRPAWHNYGYQVELGRNKTSLQLAIGWTLAWCRNLLWFKCSVVLLGRIVPGGGAGGFLLATLADLTIIFHQSKDEDFPAAAATVADIAWGSVCVIEWLLLWIQDCVQRSCTWNVLQGTNLFLWHLVCLLIVHCHTFFLHRRGKPMYLFIPSFGFVCTWRQANERFPFRVQRRGRSSRV